MLVVGIRNPWNKVWAGQQVCCWMADFCLPGWQVRRFTRKQKI